MKKVHAQMCWQIAQELADDMGRPVTQRFYRSIKRLFENVPLREREYFTAQNIKVALKRE